MKNISIANMFISIARIIRSRSHGLVIFIVIVACGLMACILILNNILSNPSDSSLNLSPTTSTTFDQTTINQIKKLKTSEYNVNP